VAAWVRTCPVVSTRLAAAGTAAAGGASERIGGGDAARGTLVTLVALLYALMLRTIGWGCGPTTAIVCVKGTVIVCGGTTLEDCMGTMGCGWILGTGVG